MKGNTIFSDYDKDCSLKETYTLLELNRCFHTDESKCSNVLING